MATIDQLQRVALEEHGAEVRAGYWTRRRLLAAIFAAPTLAAAQDRVRDLAAFEQRNVAELNRLAVKGGLTKEGAV